MPRYDAYDGIETVYPDLADVPEGSELTIMVDGRSFNITPAQVVSIVSADGFSPEDAAAMSEAFDALFESTDWRAGAVGADVTVLDEDNFASNSDTAVPTQQSTKAYVDAGLALKSDITHTQEIDSITGLQDALDAKLDADDASTTNARAIADGDYGFFTVASGVAAPDDGTIANAALANMASGTIKGRITSGAGVPEDLTPGQALDILANAPAQDLGDFGAALVAPMTVEIGVCTYADWLAATSFTKPYTPYFDATVSAPQAIAYAATVTLDYADGGNVTSRIPYINATGNCAVVFDNVDDAWIGREIEVTFYNTSGGSITVGPTIGTNNGITVKHASGITNPGIGTGAGDELTAVVWVRSASILVVRGYHASAA